MTTVRAVLDACVLYQAALRDTFLGAAADGLFEAFWSTFTVDEVTRNLVADGRTTLATAKRIAEAMHARFPQAEWCPANDLINQMTVHPKDRHVAAAAVATQSAYLVTLNLRDFPAAALHPYQIAPVHPDDFLTQLFRQSPDAMRSVLTQQQAKLKRPPIPMAGVLQAISLAAPNFVSLIRPLLTETGDH